MKFTTHTSHRWLFLTLLIIGQLLICTSTLAEAPTGILAKPAGLSHIWVGASYTDPLRLLVGLTTLMHHDGYSAESISILGAPLSWNWTHPEQNQWPDKLAATKKWDYLTLMCCGSDDEDYAVRFAKEAYKGNSKCQVFIYTIWPLADEDFVQRPDIHSEVHGEAVAAAIAKAFPDAPKPLVVPLSLLIRDLGLMADRGELPHTLNRFEMYADGGHLSDMGMYAANVLLCAMLYQESPFAYPNDIYQFVGADGKPNHSTYYGLVIPEDTAKVIKHVAWDILQTYPPAGMKPTLVIVNRSLPPVIADQPYTVTLQSLHAVGGFTWSITTGTLPTGLTLSNVGVISGIAKDPGNYPVTIALKDQDQTFNRELLVQVNQNLTPTIPNQTLDDVSRGQHVFHPLKIEGGVGHITVSQTAGTLPHGVMLSPSGILVGSPGEEGVFSFTVKVEDAFPGGARSTEKSLTWKIGPATPDTLLLKYILENEQFGPKSFTIDGKLDEPFWKLDQTINIRSKGTPSKVATFGLIWTKGISAYSLSNGVGNLVLAVKVLDGPKGKTPSDGVHIFIDGNHNKSVIYSADDTHFYVPRSQIKSGWATTVQGKVNWFTQAVVHEIDGGYIMEMSIMSVYVMGSGNWVKYGPNGVYGFDVAVDEGEGDNISQQVWHGDAHNAEDTNHFGTIILDDTPAPLTR